MTGFVGIFSVSRDEAVDAGEVERLVACYESLRGAGEHSLHRAGNRGAAVGITSPGVARSTHSGESWILWTGSPHPSLSPPVQNPEDHDGQFGFVTYDAETGTVTVGTDPFGLQAVYFARRNRKCFVSTSALALAKFLRFKASRFYVTAFVCTGYHFGKATNWEGVERLNPGSALVLDSSSCTERVYFRPELDENMARLPLREAVDAYTALAVAQLGSRFSNPSRRWANLTGGFDTRLLDLLLDRAGVSFQTCMRGDERDPEVEISRAIARLKNWGWTLFTLPSGWGDTLRPLLPSALAWSDGHLSMLDVGRTLWKHQQTGRVDRCVLEGGGGEALRNYAWQQEILTAGRSSRVNMSNWLDMKLLRAADASAFRSNPLPAIRSDFSHRMLGWVEPYVDALNVTKLDLMYAYRITGHFGNYASAAAAFADCEHPFFWRATHSLAISTNHRHRRGHKFMRHLIHSLDPGVASLETYPWRGSAEPIGIHNAHRFVPYYLDLWRRGANKVSSKLRGRSLFAGSAGPDIRVQSAVSALLDHARSVHSSQLHPSDLRTRSLYDPTRLEHLLESAAERGERASTLLGRVVTAELALDAADSELAD